MVSEEPPYLVYIVETLLGKEANLGDNHCQPNTFVVSQDRVISQSTLPWSPGISMVGGLRNIALRHLLPSHGIMPIGRGCLSSAKPMGRVGWLSGKVH